MAKLCKRIGIGERFKKEGLILVGAFGKI